MFLDCGPEPGRTNDCFCRNSTAEDFQPEPEVTDDSGPFTTVLAEVLLCVGLFIALCAFLYIVFFRKSKNAGKSEGPEHPGAGWEGQEGQNAERINGIDVTDAVGAQVRRAQRRASRERARTSATAAESGPARSWSQNKFWFLESDCEWIQKT